MEDGVSAYELLFALSAEYESTAETATHAAWRCGGRGGETECREGESERGEKREGIKGKREGRRGYSVEGESEGGKEEGKKGRKWRERNKPFTY